MSLVNSIFHCNQAPPQKSEQEIQEEEELQLALALSKSEEENKAKEVNQPFNPFTSEFLTWTLPSLNLDTFIVANRGFSQKSITEWQTVLYLMRRLVMSCLIWICTVCKDICIGQ